jgi:hypothetical protein
MAQKGIVDLFLIYQFIKRLVTPFDQWDAYKAGVIDKDGRVIIPKNGRTQDQQNLINKNWSYYDRLLANLKKLLAKVPGGKTRLASYAAALLLLREEDEKLLNDPGYLQEQLENQMRELNESTNKNFSDLRKLIEDAPANATGAAVAGTGDDPVHWSRRQPKIGQKGQQKKYGQSFDAMAFLRRRKKEMAKKVTK